MTHNPLTKRIKVTLTGGGGGGGGAFNGGGASDKFSGVGGTAGATCIKWFNVADITDWTLVIGSGGTEATRGGDSKFAGVIESGGAPSVANGPFASGDTGASGTGGDINLPGGDGGDGQNGTALLSAFGGASYWGEVDVPGKGNRVRQQFPTPEFQAVAVEGFLIRKKWEFASMAVRVVTVAV